MAASVAGLDLLKPSAMVVFAGKAREHLPSVAHDSLPITFKVGPTGAGVATPDMVRRGSKGSSQPPEKTARRNPVTR